MHKVVDNLVNLVGVDVHEAGRNLACLGILQVLEVEGRYVTLLADVYHTAGLALREELVDTHTELGKVSKAEMFNTLLEKRCKALGLKVKSRPVEIGYEVRCQTPCAFDLVYCSQLGMGVYKLFSEGKTGCMVYISQEGYVSPLYLKDLQDPETGKIPPRLVDINADKIHQVIDNLMHYITPADYEAAKAYIPNPEEYDFKKILNW